MEGITHGQMVSQLAKNGEAILVSLTPHRVHLWHMATGISGEAGELLDAIKKNAAYDKEIDLENVVEELGDMEFYMEGLRQGLGITREQCLEANMKKLAVRYKNFEFTNQAAHDRADKAEDRKFFGQGEQA